MYIFANSKQHFRSFMEFYDIHLKNQGRKFDHSTTLLKENISTQDLWFFLNLD